MDSFGTRTGETLAVLQQHKRGAMKRRAEDEDQDGKRLTKDEAQGLGSSFALCCCLLFGVGRQSERVFQLPATILHVLQYGTVPYATRA
jgi:hypothetical protein